MGFFYDSGGHDIFLGSLFFGTPGHFSDFAITFDTDHVGRPYLECWFIVYMILLEIICFGKFCLHTEELFSSKNCSVIFYCIVIRIAKCTKRRISLLTESLFCLVTYAIASLSFGIVSLSFGIVSTTWSDDFSFT